MVQGSDDEYGRNAESYSLVGHGVQLNIIASR